jgi:hypothetical protein
MSEAAVAVDKPAPAITLVEARMGLSESKRQDWVVDAEEGHTVEQVLDPMYWAHVAPKFTLYDRVEVRVDTGEWMLELIVIQTGRNFARVHVAARHDFTTSPSAAAPKSSIRHKIEYKGTHKKHCVIRIADSALLQEGFQTRDMASEWLANYERVTTS